MKYIYIFISAFWIFTSACEQHVTRYKYKNTTLTRKDEDATTYIYYGDCKNNVFPDSYIRIDYSGFNNCMGAFLVFNIDGTVEVKNSGCGDFDLAQNTDKRLYMREYENVDYIKWVDSISHKYNNIIWISNILKIEKSDNYKNKSQVKVTY